MTEVHDHPMDIFPDQPDFEVMAQALHTAGNEAAKAVNMTPARANADILQAIQNLARTNEEAINNLSQTMTREFTTLRSDVTAIKSELTTLNTEFSTFKDEMPRRMAAVSHNTVARSKNFHAIKPRNELAPLRSLQNNMEIPHFPATVEDLAGLRLSATRAILRELEESADGTAEECKHRLRLAVGMAGWPFPEIVEQL